MRSLREEADQEETDLSYLRRMLQGRIDIVAAELIRRSGDEASGIVGELPQILSDGPRGQAHGLGRHQVTEPSNAGSTRRAEEAAAAMDVTDLSDRDDDEVHALLESLRATEADISARRRAVQGVYDTAAPRSPGATATAAADVGDLLREEAD